MLFLHTADWQVGMKAASLGASAARVRDERLLAAARVVDVARHHHVDCILLAGDVFEDNAVDRLLVQRTADTLRAAGCPVYVIPGNHDPDSPGSPWEHPAWAAAQNVHVLRTAEPVPLAPDAVLYPCPLSEKTSSRDPTSWIPPRTDARLRVGLAHGTVVGVPTPEPDYPIPPDAADRLGLDYLALGHWHSLAHYPSPDGAIRQAYSGTHEPTAFGERDSGNVLLVDLPAPGAPPVLTPIPTAGLVWHARAHDLRAPGDLAAVLATLDAIPLPANALVRLTLTGLYPAQDAATLAHLNQVLATRFLHGELDATALHPAPDDDGWLLDLPPGTLREAAARLRATAAAPGNPEAALASAALAELYAIVKGVSR